MKQLTKYLLLLILIMAIINAGCHNCASDKIKTSKSFHLRKLSPTMTINGRQYGAQSIAAIENKLVDGYLINDTLYTWSPATVLASTIRQPQCMGNGICILSASVSYNSVPATFTYGARSVACNVVFGMSNSSAQPGASMVVDKMPLVMSFDKSIYLTGELPDPFTDGGRYPFEGNYLLADAEGILAPLNLPAGAMIMRGPEGAGYLRVSGPMVTDLIPIYRPGE